jgi:hypothetical protein
MWRMETGDRVLTELEWNLFRVGLETLWDYIADDSDEDLGLSETGVRVFDVLQTEQKLALLADIAQALRDPAMPMPSHTAANEGAVAAVFATIRQALEMEIELASVDESESTEVRSLLLAAVVDSEDQPAELPGLKDDDIEEWESLIQAVEFRILWDTDYAMGDEFLDRPPEEAHVLQALMTIDSDYYTTVPREPDRAGLIVVRQTLARLLGRPVPDDEGLYPALQDLYHDLFVVPCTQEEIDAWADHPWMCAIAQGDPNGDCTFAVWNELFRNALPAAPFVLPDGGVVPTEGSLNWPDDVQVERYADAWVIRNDLGYYWCDAPGNGWANNPNDEMSVLTFPSREAAEAVYRHANKMYGERAARHDAAMALLDRLSHTD